MTADEWARENLSASDQAGTGAAMTAEALAAFDRAYSEGCCRCETIRMHVLAMIDKLEKGRFYPGVTRRHAQLWRRFWAIQEAINRRERKVRRMLGCDSRTSADHKLAELRAAAGVAPWNPWAVKSKRLHG